MRRHAVMRHRPPRMVLRWGLREPHRRRHNRQAGRSRAPARRHRDRQILPRAVFTRLAPRFILAIIASSKRFSVSGRSGALIVTTSQTGTIAAGVLWKVTPSSFSTASGKPVAVGIVQLDVERLQPAKHSAADPPGTHRADRHALDIVRARDAVGDLPAPSTSSTGGDDWRRGSGSS